MTWMAKYVLSRAEYRDRYMHEITRSDWKKLFGPHGALINEFKRSPATHNRVRAMISKMYEDARREYEPPRATENPIRDIKPLPESKKEIPILSNAEVIKRYVMAAFKYKLESWGPFVMISLNTGLRQSNVMAIRWRDIDWEGNRIWIREKYTRRGFLPGSKSSSDERVVGMTPPLKATLLFHRQRTHYKSPEDFVITKSRGRPFRDSDVWDAHKRTLKAAELPYIKPHALRHTYGTHYMNNGGSLHDLKLNLFHSSIKVTEKYAHALPNELSRRAGVFQVPVLPEITPEQIEKK